MKQIVCLSNESWSSSPGRTQQLMARMKGVKILYFSPADTWKTASLGAGGRKVRPNITVYTLPAHFFPQKEQLGALFRFEQRRISKFIAAKMSKHRMREPLLWVTSPEHVHFLDNLEYRGLVYDCDREWDHLPLTWEGTLAAASDLVFAASVSLAERLSPCSNNIAALPNGVSYPLFSSHFSSPHRKLPKTPTFGWTGTIYDDLDLSPLLYVARARPEWNFVLIGKRQHNPYLNKLSHMHNVSLRTHCPLSELPEQLGRCHGLLNFLRLDQAGSDIIPTRIYEYLSTGLPIVSMLWPDQIEHFPDVIYGANTHEEFLTLCEHALEEVPTLFSQRRKAHGAAASWSHRVEEVSRILEVTGLL